MSFPIKELFSAADNNALLAELDAHYAELDRRVAAHQPVCRNRGACCKFDSYGHKLYVTTLELAYFTAQHIELIRDATVRERSLDCSQGDTALPVVSQFRQLSCPFQQNGFCTTRQGRPIGCRVFFCESASEGWQNELTEWSLAQLRRLHEHYQIPYRYTEWLTALGELNETAQSR